MLIIITTTTTTAVMTSNAIPPMTAPTTAPIGTPPLSVVVGDSVELVGLGLSLVLVVPVLGGVLVAGSRR